MDPLQHMWYGQGSIPDPAAICNYSWEAGLSSLTGLANFRLSDLIVDSEYVDLNDYNNTVIKLNLGFDTCDFALRADGHGRLLRDKGYGKNKLGRTDLCKKSRTKLNVGLSLQLALKMRLSMSIHLNKLIEG